MGLNASKGNMYSWITHTWNTVKGKCFHDCIYCYMKRFKNQKEIRFDNSELKTDLGSGNFIFIGSSNDLFAENVPNEWIEKTLNHCAKFDNKYLFQTKNPKRVLYFIDRFDVFIKGKSVVCTTIESNRFYPDIMKNSPTIESRVNSLIELKSYIPIYVTVEPILDFDILELAQILISIEPKQVNIGSDSGNNKLIEPSEYKIVSLIDLLTTKGIKVKQKDNLKRLLK